MKPKPRWKSIIVERQGESLTAYLHPPGTRGNSRYWSFTCKKANITKKSLKATTFAEAKEKAHAWFREEPRREERVRREEAVLAWDEWDSIQARHFAKKADRKRADRTLEECRKARRLFVAVTGAGSASAVDADVVERFQIDCAGRRSKFGRPYGATTIRKTLAHMSASFNRCRHGSGKKCVRGVVAAEKLLTANPFEEVAWVEADVKEARQFTRAELKAFLNWKYLGECPLASLFARVSLWSCGRIEEMTELRWDWVGADGYVAIPDDAAKWGKGRTVRLPSGLLREIERHRVAGPYVWAGYVDQLRAYHRTAGNHSSSHKIRDFTPLRMRGLFQKWVGEWARESKAEGLSHHAFRRTGLQWSREGQLRAAEGDYARASNVGLAVADKHYTSRPERLWADVVFRNIAGEIAGDEGLAALMGLEPDVELPARTKEAVLAALARNDLEEAAKLLARLRG